MSSNDPLTEKYVENVGRPPANLPEDHPDRWQWEYRGTKAEREELLGKLGLDDDQADEQITQEETLFGDAA